MRMGCAVPWMWPSVSGPAYECRLLKHPHSSQPHQRHLAGVGTPSPFCVSLNPAGKVDESQVLRRFVYDHPVFNLASIQAQKARADICGQAHTHFCGAYWYNGFHEDGVRSALDVAERFGATL